MPFIESSKSFLEKKLAMKIKLLRKRIKTKIVFFNGKNVSNLKTSKANPPIQIYIAKKIGCSPVYINKLVNNRS